jgi:hypothetical protein
MKIALLLILFLDNWAEMPLDGNYFEVHWENPSAGSH